MLRSLLRSLVSSSLLAAGAAAQPPTDPPRAPASSVPLAPGLAFADDVTVRAPMDLLRGRPTRTADGLVHAVVEIPAGTNEKWEVKADGVLRWDMKDGKPRVVQYLGYPCNYGMVPRTRLGKELGGDGDPLDVLVLGPAVPRGTVVAVRVLGTIRLVDAGEKDDKLLAVPADSPLAQTKTLAELDTKFPGVTAILATWFQNYKGKDALQCSGFGDAAQAEELLAAAEASFGKEDEAPAGATERKGEQGEQAQPARKK